ncbi:MAG: hypothetical protein GVY04_11325 [Cyanobacteria bacterium]|nr:hypothetical protein [Cyanobacteria bacterium GSL.Bin1]
MTVFLPGHTFILVTIALPKKDQPRGVVGLAGCIGRRKFKLHQDRLTLL